MRIVYFVNYFPPVSGAAALNSLKIAKYLIDLGHELLILIPGNMGKTFNSKSTENFNFLKKMQLIRSCKLIKFPFNLTFSHFENVIRFFIKTKSIYKPDIILSQYHAFHYASVAGASVAKIINLPHIIRSHDIFLDFDFIHLSRKLFHWFSYPLIHKSILHCDIFYTTTSEMKKYLENIRTFKNINFKVHHNGIDLNQFTPNNNNEILKDKYNCNNIISFIGLITPEMGLQNLIKVFPKILNENKETHLIIIGDGSFKEQILYLIKKLDLTKNIHFLGIQPHHKIPFFVNNSDIGIGLLLHKEIWKYCIPVKCLEYLACKKPFITTPISRDLLKNNDVGIELSKNYNQSEIVYKLNLLLEDKNLKKKMGENGFLKIYKRFRWDVLMDEFNKDLLKFEN
ncbi:MAG: glycosyltransferase family 4 protein [Promethearchaeota archaeon]